MLYDPKWEKSLEQKASPLSLAGLIEWLETQNPAQKYDWHDCGGSCLIDRYGAAIGYPGLTHRDELRTIFPDLTDYSRVCNGLDRSKWTFGDALTRARAVLAQST